MGKRRIHGEGMTLNYPIGFKTYQYNQVEDGNGGNEEDEQEEHG